MANKVPMELIPFMSPDSLRQVTHLMKNMFDLHTKRYCGYTDINGSQYEGTIENWGSESLLESRKILLDKPALENIFIENTMSFYFDIQYSDLIDNYHQQNMLCAVLRKDVLLSKNTYRLRFDNVERFNVPRSQSYSDPNVFNDKFYHTNVPPKLIIEDELGNITEEVMKVTDVDGNVTDYYFHLDIDTIGMYNEESLDGDTFTTLPLDDSMNGFGCIWMCVNLLRTLPIVNIMNNVLDDKILMTIGTNGHDVSLMYPLFNYTEEDVADYNKYLIKVIPSEEDAFFQYDANNRNYNVAIKEIHILEYDVSSDPSDMDPGRVPINDTVILYNQEYCKITLSNFNVNNDTNIPFADKWYFKKPVEGDYDYDGRTYKNNIYAYTNMKSFISNIIENDSMKKVAGFKIVFNDAFIHPYEGLCENAYTGIHVDVSSDYSDNGVSKKNGVIHDLGDFDGLPPYFKYMTDRNTHRAHLEIYAIRDKFNDYNQKAIDKQTAGIIFDSGIPQNELQDVNKNMPVVIYFDQDNLLRRKYIFKHDDVNITKNNNLSEITFTNPYRFGNSKMAKHQSEKKFVYHGNRKFSTGVTGFDSEMETGRVYILSNDPAKYINNETATMYKKPQITFARLCDIPTEFSQLVAIHGVSPTLVIDRNYVRTEADFSYESKDKVINKLDIDHIIRLNKNIIHPDGSIDINSCHTYMDSNFKKYININEMIHINDLDNVTYSIATPGEGYEVDDTFLFYIGGICIKGKVEEVLENGTVSRVSYMYDNDGVEDYATQPVLDDTPINRSNFSGSSDVQGRITSYQAQSTSGSGSGLSIQLEINSILWNQTKMVDDGYIPDIIMLKMDSFNNVWSYIYNEDYDEFVPNSQISGEKLYVNINDPNTDVAYRSTSAVVIYDMITSTSNDIQHGNVNEVISLSKLNKDYDVTTTEDLSYYINSDNVNIPGAIMVFDDGFITSTKHNVVSYEVGYVDSTQSLTKYPAYNDINTEYYVNKTNKFHWYNDIQPSLWLYNYQATNVIEYTKISKDFVILGESKPICIYDIISDGIYTPENLIDSSGFLTRNLYYNEDFSSYEMNDKINTLKEYTRNILIDIIKSTFPDATLLRYENTSYAYTKDMLIDYIIQNSFIWNRNADYSNCTETIYRRPQAKLFRTKGEQVCDKAHRPIGKQPTGRFDIITNEIFNPNVIVDGKNTEAEPVFIFRLDTYDEHPSLSGFRLYDEDDNDISDYSILIVDGVICIATHDTNDTIDWIPIIREEMEEDD